MSAVDFRSPFGIGDAVRIDAGDIVGYVISITFYDPTVLRLEVGWIHSGLAQTGNFPPARLSAVENKR